MVRAGRRLGRYRVIADIARGGMASVHLARLEGPAGFTRTVALKVPHAHLVDDPVFVAMFLDEARLAARIHHPNVVSVHDVAHFDGELVMVMEHVEGLTLATLDRLAVAAGGPLPPGVSLRIMHDALRGLHAAHELLDEDGQTLGLVHRDVSPQNILVGTDGIARIADFGVAKAKNRLSTTRTDAVKGKMRYLAPEQLARAPLDRRVDVFAAGVVLWESLTGKRLFDGDDDASTLAMVLWKPIPPPSMAGGASSLSLDEVCLRALEREPSARYSTAAELASALSETVALASQTEVAGWVNRLGGPSLTALRATTETPQDGPETLTAIETSTPRSRSRWAPLLGAVTALGIAGLGFVLLRGPSAAGPALAAPMPSSVAAVEDPDAGALVASPPPGSAPVVVASSTAKAPRPKARATRTRPVASASAKWVPDAP